MSRLFYECQECGRTQIGKDGKLSDGEIVCCPDCSRAMVIVGCEGMAKQMNPSNPFVKPADVETDDIAISTIYADGKPIRISVMINLDVNNHVSLSRINKALIAEVCKAKRNASPA